MSADLYSASRIRDLDPDALDIFVRDRLAEWDADRLGTTKFVYMVCDRMVGSAADIDQAKVRLFNHLRASAATHLSDCAIRGEPIEMYGKTARPWLWSKSNGVVWSPEASPEKPASLAEHVKHLEARLAELEKKVAIIHPTGYPPFPTLDPLGAKS